MVHLPTAEATAADPNHAMRFSGPHNPAEADYGISQLKGDAVPEVESPQLALDLLLHDVAEHVRRQTNASGAAIALEGNGEMVCRAAAGITAPDLGARINTQSGLTGACVREQQAQCCEDTETDQRVDADVCRRLGVRSIMVVPIITYNRPIGVLEVFSPLPYTFDQEQLKTLQNMASWVIAACQSSASKDRRLEQRTSSAVPSPTWSDPARSTAATVMAARRPLGRSDDHVVRTLRRIALGLTILLCVILTFRFGRGKLRPAQHAAVPTRAQIPVGMTDQDAALKGRVLSSGLPTSRPDQLDAQKGPVKKAGLIVYKDGAIIYRQPTGSRLAAEKAGKSEPTGEVARSASSPSPSETAMNLGEAAPPPVTGSTAGDALMPSNLLDVSKVAIPGRRMSKVVEARLIYSVTPRYPEIAAEHRLHGSVIVHARIGKDGRMHDLKARTGDAILVQAAIQAIRQWRYEPSKLNGQPVDTQIDITVNFSVPE